MTPEQFDICLEFHLGLIRSRPHKQTINDARNGISNSAANNLIKALESRMEPLQEWNKRNISQMDIYNRNNTRNPSESVFIAANNVMHWNMPISKAAKLQGVNYQSVKVLIPRLERWEEFAQKLAKTL